MRLAIFDFDGTLFASPERPSWWPFQGFWGRPESLNPPYVPEKPGTDWWSPKVVSAARRAFSDSGTYTVLLTGRQPKLGARVKELLHGQGLRFDEYHFSNGDDTLPFKLGVVEKLIKELSPDYVEMWEDRSEHIGDFERKLSELVPGSKVHKMPRVTHEFENPPTTAALRVAARWQVRVADIIGDPVSLIRNFEIVVTDLAILEKDLPWMLEAEKVWNSEGKLWSYEDIKRMRAEGDPRYKQISSYNSYLHDFVLKVKFSTHGFHRAQAQFLFLSILQQYDLPPNVRKSIEAAAQYHSKARRAPKKEDALEAYTKMMALIRGQLAAAKEAITRGKPRAMGEEAESQDELRAGPFRVINTGGFDDKTMDEVQEVAKKAAQLLQTKGITRVLYGDVLVSRTLSKQNVLAFYLTSKDELFVRANLRGKQHDAVRTVCHELGHRLHFKFLQAKDKEIRGIYNQIARKSSASKKDKIQEVLKDHPVLPGDTYVEKGEVYEVTGTDWGPKGLVVKMVKKDPPAPGLVQKAFIGLEGYLVNKGLLTNQELTGFVTRYASKDYQENFAEMIAFWCLDKLPEDQVELLRTVL